jgi:hypothetical protein
MRLRRVRRPVHRDRVRPPRAKRSPGGTGCRGTVYTVVAASVEPPSQNLVVPDLVHRKRDPFGAGPALAPTPTSRPRFDVAPPAPGGLAANGPPRLGQQPVLAPAVNSVRLGIEALANLYQPNRLMLSVRVRHGTPRPRRGGGATGKQAHDAKLTLRPRRDDGELTRSQRHPCGLPCSPWPASLPPVP